MSDVFTSEKRSLVMSRIRGRGNRDTELRLIKVFRSLRITGWRRNSRLFGKPDFVFPRQRIAVFVDGCFWHSCPRPGHSNRPRNNAAFWDLKLRRNVERDKVVNRTLRKQGWVVVRIWEHNVRESGSSIRRIQKLLAN